MVGVCFIAIHCGRVESVCIISHREETSYLTPLGILWPALETVKSLSNLFTLLHNGVFDRPSLLLNLPEQLHYLSP